MRFFDPKFQGHRKNYFIQSALAMMIIFLMSSVVDVFLQTTIVASFGATVFILYTMPHKKASGARYVFGGYTIGIIVGFIASALTINETGLAINMTMALAVGLAIFFMVVTNTEHPPAAALALGIAIEQPSFMEIASIYMGLIIVFYGKRMLQRWLIDLM